MSSRAAATCPRTTACSSATSSTPGSRTPSTGSRASGSTGPQDLQADDPVRQWMYGADFHYHRQNLVLRGEFVQGHADGKTDKDAPEPCNLAPCLRFKGAYGLVGYRLTNIVMPYVRVD